MKACCEIVKCIRSGNLLKEEWGGEGNLHAIRITWINLRVNLSNIKTNRLTITITKKMQKKIFTKQYIEQSWTILLYKSVM